MSVPVCYLCGNDTDFEPLPSAMRYKTNSRPWRCLKCGLVLLSPPMTPAEEARYYEIEYARIYASEKGTDIANLDEARLSDAKMYFDWVERHIVPGKDCLEVGCASGYFLKWLRRKQYRVEGVEPHLALALMCLNDRIVVHKSIVEVRSASVDYLFAFFLLEHLGDPLKFLRHVCRVCRPEGKVFIVVPNVNDALLSAYDIPAFQDFYFTPAHQFYYSRETLAAMLTKAGLKNHRIYPKQRYDLSNHIHWMTRGKPGGQGKYIDVHGSFTNECYQQQLRHRFMCDTLLAVVEV